MSRGVGAQNGNWRGGRSVASNGYVLVRVGRGHHLADVRGYAYEHRIVAEQKIGRRLAKGEVVHHVDGNKQNNDPGNIEVMPDAAHHKYEHRIRTDKRAPWDENPLVSCACGCGATLRKFDGLNRPRAFLSGHNRPNNKTQASILAALSAGPRDRLELSVEIGTSVRAVAVCLSRLKAAGRVEPLRRGVWRLVAEGSQIR